MGSAEALELFAKAYESLHNAWLRATEHLSRELRATGLDGKDRDISLVAFADDVFRKLVWDGRDCADGVRLSAA